MYMSTYIKYTFSPASVHYPLTLRPLQYHFYENIFYFLLNITLIIYSKPIPVYLLSSKIIKITKILYYKKKTSMMFGITNVWT